MKSSKVYESFFTKFGLKPQEASVYLACLQLGQTTASKISGMTGIQRTFVYDILNGLIEKGLAYSIPGKSKRYYHVVSIERFKIIQDEKLNKLGRLLPELKALEKATGDRPTVRFYEGTEGIKEALFDTLNQSSSSEILAYATGEGLYYDDPGFASEYIKRRLRKNITVRAIAPDTSATRFFTDKDKEHGRMTRLIPADRFPFTNEIDIYGNKIALISVVGEQIAVIIESESIAKTQRSIFELAWDGARVNHS